MRRKVYYKAFLKMPKYECLQLTWFQDLVDPDRVDEYLTEIQITHMKNRLIGGWRSMIPFNIQYSIGEIVQLDYSI
jgi:hypothetical protein